MAGETLKFQKFFVLIFILIILTSIFCIFIVKPASATITTVYASADNLLMVNSEKASTANTAYPSSELGVGFYYVIGPVLSSYLGSASAIKFNIDALIGGKTITKATLILWPYGLPTDFNTQYAVNAMAAAWNTATITWNNQPNYYLSGEARINPPVTTAIAMEFDVTAIVQNWAKGTLTNNGFLLRDTTVSFPGSSAFRQTYIESLEYNFNSGHRPQLYLEYVGDKVATPTFNPQTGTLFTDTQDVAISCTTPSSTIRYTTDGSIPTSSHGTLYSGTITISSSTTIKAIAYKSGYTDSDVAQATYTKSAPSVVATPTFNPGGGTYSSAQSVTISCTTPGATIRYTTNGVDPTSTTGTAVSSGGSVTVSSSLTLKAKAFLSGWTDSSVATAAFTINIAPSVVATPTFSPGGGTYSSTQTVTISCITSGASIRYTTDGSTPTSSFGTVYSGAISVGSTATIKAIAYKTGMTDSEVTTATYTINIAQKVATPTINPAAGTYSSPQSVTITCATPGATIRYTTDGSNPTTSSTLYSGSSLYVQTSITLKARAFSSGMTDSDVASAAYTINSSPQKVATPTITPGTGTYSTAQTVTLYCSTSGATIRYTTNGIDPTSTTGTVISSGGSLTVSTSMTVKAKAFMSSMTDSDVAAAVYTINIQPNTVATPTFSPVSGTYTSTQYVTISCSTPGATIRYTLDGTTNPTSTTGTIYSGTITIGSTTTVKAKAFLTGWTDSDLATGTFTISTSSGGDNSGGSNTNSGGSNTQPTTDTTKPIANAGSDISINQSNPVKFSGNGSTDNIGITSYTWTFVDATSKTLTGISPTYTFNIPGEYTVTLTVKDAKGNSGSDTLTVTVLDTTKPDIEAGENKAATAGEVVTFVAGSTSTDVANYVWDFGDGTSGTGKNVTHTYAAAGDYTATLTITDQAGNANTDTLAVKISGSDNVSLIIGVVAVVAVAIAAIGAFMFTKKHKIPPPPIEEPSNSTQTSYPSQLQKSNSHLTNRKTIKKHCF